MATAQGLQPLPPLEQDDILIVKVEEDFHLEEDRSLEAEDPSPETFRQLFRLFCYQEVAGPREALSRLWELCCRWLQPELRSKEQILEMLVLEQFLTVLPGEIQARVREWQPESGEEAVVLVEGLQQEPRKQRVRWGHLVPEVRKWALLLRSAFGDSLGSRVLGSHGHLEDLGLPEHCMEAGHCKVFLSLGQCRLTTYSPTTPF